MLQVAEPLLLELMVIQPQIQVLILLHEYHLKEIGHLHHYHLLNIEQMNL